MRYVHGYRAGGESIIGRVSHAADGGFLETPLDRTRLLLAPGERAEVVIDASAAATPLTLMSAWFRAPPTSSIS